ncbi:MAG: hypothetical protein CL537_07745 [Alcanivoracaceae bacterium]|nr:hypothetical protein [Alcanivoracaceae bacterium]
MIPGINTGGGGLSYSDASNATAGPTSSGINQTIGGLNINTDNKLLWVLIVAVALVVGWLLWKQFS